LIGNEFIEVGISIHAPSALFAMSKADIAERARGDVAVERFDRTTELGSGLGGGLKPVGGREAQLACGTFLPLERKPSAICLQAFRTIKVLAAKSHERRGQACGSRRIFL
jgi:hypothetical protein